MEFDQLLVPGLDVSLAGGTGAGACVAAVSPLPAQPQRWHVQQRHKNLPLPHTTSCLPGASKNKRTAWLEQQTSLKITLWSWAEGRNCSCSDKWFV